MRERLAGTTTWQTTYQLRMFAFVCSWPFVLCFRSLFIAFATSSLPFFHLGCVQELNALHVPFLHNFTAPFVAPFRPSVMLNSGKTRDIDAFLGLSANTCTDLSVNKQPQNENYSDFPRCFPLFKSLIRDFTQRSMGTKNRQKMLENNLPERQTALDIDQVYERLKEDTSSLQRSQWNEENDAYEADVFEFIALADRIEALREQRLHQIPEKPSSFSRIGLWRNDVM